MHDNSDHSLLADSMFEPICAAVEESEKSWNSVAEFEDAVSRRFSFINGKGGRMKKKVYQSKSATKPPNGDAGDVNEVYSKTFTSDKMSDSPAVDPSVVRDGIDGMNEYATAAFMSMMEELREDKGVDVEEKRHQQHRSKINGSMPGFFAAKPVKRNEYLNDTDAMKAYWKE